MIEATCIALAIGAAIFTAVLFIVMLYIAQLFMDIKGYELLDLCIKSHIIGFYVLLIILYLNVIKETF